MQAAKPKATTIESSKPGPSKYDRAAAAHYEAITNSRHPSYHLHRTVPKFIFTKKLPQRDLEALASNQ